jgi:hypothetical protein
MNRFPNGSFDVRDVARGPLDDRAGDGSYKGSAKVRILWNGEQMWEMRITAPWSADDNPASFQLKVLKIASRQLAELALAVNTASDA